MKSGVGGKSNEGFNRSWGLSLTGMDFSRVSILACISVINFFANIEVEKRVQN